MMTKEEQINELKEVLEDIRALEEETRVAKRYVQSVIRDVREQNPGCRKVRWPVYHELVEELNLTVGRGLKKGVLAKIPKEHRGRG